MKTLFSVVLAVLAFAGCEKKDNPASDVNRYSIPNKPSNVRLEVDSLDNNVYAVWQDNSDNEDGFKVILNWTYHQAGDDEWSDGSFQGITPENASSSNGWVECTLDSFRVWADSFSVDASIAAFNLSGDTIFVEAAHQLVLWR